MLVQDIKVEEKSSTKNFENYLNSQNIFMEKDNKDNLLAKAIDMLKMWGACNAYSSKCGYKNVSSMFTSLYPKNSFIFVENELEFVDECIKEAKNSKNAKKREQQELAELYYRGLDIVLGGKDWSERLTIREIADMKNMSKSTVDRRLKAFESYIANKLAMREDIFY